MNRKERRSAQSQDKTSMQAQLMLRAITLHQAGNLAEAEGLYKNVLASNPKNAEALGLLGVIVAQHGQLEEGVKLLSKAITLNPKFVDGYLNRGIALHKLKRYADALTDCDKAIAFTPMSALAHYTRGMALYDLGRYEDALASYGKAITIQPRYEEAYYDHGLVLYSLNRYDEAIASYDKAIAINPQHAMAHWNKGLIKLLQGEFEEGWPLFEWRWKKSDAGSKNIVNKPLWLGKEPLAGKTILLHREQGLGDVIQFCRYVPMVEALGAKVILGVTDSLTGVISTLKGQYTLVGEGTFNHPLNFHCPLLSLPLAFATTASNIPADIPYLYADPDKQKLWQERLGPKTKPRVGLVWSGATDHGNDHNRSIALKRMLPLLNCDIEFHSLQKEIRPSDREVMAGQANLLSHAEHLQDFTDTAALAMQMDMIISVDTSVAHLCGALGRPTWILLPYTPDWRWLLGRDDTPWYPTVRLFRQQKTGDWENVIEKVRTEFLKLKSGGHDE